MVPDNFLGIEKVSSSNFGSTGILPAWLLITYTSHVKKIYSSNISIYNSIAIHAGKMPADPKFDKESFNDSPELQELGKD